MTNESKPNPGNSTPETTTTAPASPTPRKGKAAKKPKAQVEDQERVAMTFTFSAAFGRHLKTLGGSLDVSLSDFVEATMAPVVRRELRKVLEGLV